MTEKHKKILLEQINEEDIIEEVMGNDTYVALTNTDLYFVKTGVRSGMFFGKKIKTFPLDSITSIDVGKRILTGYLEVTIAGGGGSTSAYSGIGDLNENKAIINLNQILIFQKLADKIRKLIKKNKAGSNVSSEADELEKLHSLMEKGIITKEEFESKKKKLLEL